MTIVQWLHLVVIMSGFALLLMSGGAAVGRHGITAGILAAMGGVVIIGHSIIVKQLWGV